MRKPYVAGNWKMNLNRAEAVALASAVVKGASYKDIDVGMAPPFVYLDAVAAAAKGSPAHVAAQNCYFEPKGAFTGEVSPQMVLDVGCDTVILGHSERRHVLGESDETINSKVKAALAAGLKVILCLGETLDEREAGNTNDVCQRHVREGLKGVTAEQMANVVLAYEPVWAIGTGKTATPDQAQEVHAFVRPLVASLLGDAVAQAVRIQYGGSVKADNTVELMSKPDIDGALVGGASLKADSFLAIVEGTRKAKGLA
ncbi:MAG: triose-phosphate isomerase [Planctomycetes bacterium]|nr:triose-phosphate isomerase [Planctomycetota bacterium]